MSLPLTPYERALQHIRRLSLLDFEAVLARHPEAVFGDNPAWPLTHHFAPGVYGRELALKAGSLVVGKIHKHAHLVVLLQGALRLFTEAGGLQEVQAPRVMLSPPGVKRAALVLEDTRWLTIHPNVGDTQDLAALEEEIIAPSFAEYDLWRARLEAAPPPQLEEK